MKNFVSVAIAPAALIFLFQCAVVEPPAAGGRRPPIIDMHLGTSTLDDFGGIGPNCADPRSTEYPGLDSRNRITLDRVMTCAKWLPAAASDEALMKDSLERLERYNIWAVTSSDNLDRVTAWRAAAPARITPALNFRHRDRTPEQLRRLVEESKVAVFAEVGPQYGGLRVDDEMYEPYFALAEELDVPVGVHLGEGPPGGIHILGASTYRARLGSPFVLEEVLVRHKKLRIYVAHYGSPLVDEMIAMLFSHPNLYVDISCNDWLNPRAQFYDHLRRLVEAGFVKRIMWGSDQMIWPWAIDIAIEAVEQAPFLTAEQKRDIFYNNAARFLRLSQAEIAKHHGGALAPSARPRE